MGLRQVLAVQTMMIFKASTSLLLFIGNLFGFYHAEGCRAHQPVHHRQTHACGGHVLGIDGFHAVLIELAQRREQARPAAFFSRYTRPRAVIRLGKGEVAARPSAAS